jgi:hypothetical protein
MACPPPAKTTILLQAIKPSYNFRFHYSRIFVTGVVREYDGVCCFSYGLPKGNGPPLRRRSKAAADPSDHNPSIQFPIQGHRSILVAHS